MFDISFNLYVIASVLGMNKIKMFVGIFLELKFKRSIKFIKG